MGITRLHHGAEACPAPGRPHRQLPIRRVGQTQHPAEEAPHSAVGWHTQQPGLHGGDVYLGGGGLRRPLGCHREGGAQLVREGCRRGLPACRLLPQQLQQGVSPGQVLHRISLRLGPAAGLKVAALAGVLQPPRLAEAQLPTMPPSLGSLVALQGQRRRDQLLQQDFQVLFQIANREDLRHTLAALALRRAPHGAMGGHGAKRPTGQAPSLLLQGQHASEHPGIERHLHLMALLHLAAGLGVDDHQDAGAGDPEDSEVVWLELGEAHRVDGPRSGEREALLAVCPSCGLVGVQLLRHLELGLVQDVVAARLGAGRVKQGSSGLPEQHLVEGAVPGVQPLPPPLVLAPDACRRGAAVAGAGHVGHLREVHKPQLLVPGRGWVRAAQAGRAAPRVRASLRMQRAGIEHSLPAEALGQHRAAKAERLQARLCAVSLPLLLRRALPSTVGTEVQKSLALAQLIEAAQQRRGQGIQRQALCGQLRQRQAWVEQRLRRRRRFVLQVVLHRRPQAQGPRRGAALRAEASHLLVAVQPGVRQRLQRRQGELEAVHAVAAQRGQHAKGGVEVVVRVPRLQLAQGTGLLHQSPDVHHHPERPHHGLRQRRMAGCSQAGVPALAVVAGWLFNRGRLVTRCRVWSVPSTSSPGRTAYCVHDPTVSHDRVPHRRRRRLRGSLGGGGR